MPLFTDDIDSARLAYAAVESRALSAELRADKLEALLAKLSVRPPFTLTPEALLRQRIVDLEGENNGLREKVEQLQQDRADITLQAFIEVLGLAAAVGEASMPDRAIPSIAAKVQSFIAMPGGRVALRFQPPELGAQAAGLSTTSFEIAKVPPQSGVVAPPNFYAVLQAKQRVYTDPFWTRFDTAAQIIAEITKTFSETGTWNFAYLVQTAANIAALENRLAIFTSELLRGEAVAAYRAAAKTLAALADTLKAKANPVVGDLLALTSALDATTSAARSLIT